MKFSRLEWRNRAARYIRAWRKTRSIKIACVELGIDEVRFWRAVRISSRFDKNRHKYRGRCAVNTNDYCYILRFAKKVRAIQLLGGRCCRCPNDNVLQLDFHHPNADKEESVAKMRCKSWDKFWAEASKCQLLCRNCHVLTTTDTDRFERLRDEIYHKARHLKSRA